MHIFCKKFKEVMEPNNGGRHLRKCNRNLHRLSSLALIPGIAIQMMAWYFT